MGDPWDVLAKIYGVERGAPSIGGIVADRIGVGGLANRLEVEIMVSALVGNRIVQDDVLSGRSVEDDPIVRWAKDGNARGVMLVPEEMLGPTERRWGSGTLTDLVIEELARAFTAAESDEESVD